VTTSTGGTLLEALSAFAHESLGAVPTEVRASVRQRVLDIVGLQVAALRLDTSDIVRQFVASQGGAQQAHAIGVAGAVSAPWAAFANGVLAHSLDFDDTHLPSILHPSASVIPSAVAMAELTGSSGQDLVDAIAVGLETTIRVGMAGYDRATKNSIFFEHGQHATSICGTMGSALTCALLLGLDEVKSTHAMAIAASMASGIIEANRTGGSVKRIHCGWAAHAATSAAMLAAHGITGPPTALEGRFGLFEAFLHGTFNPGEVTDGLGTSWSVPGIFFKPYPANHFTHAGIDAALRLRASGLRPEDIKWIRLGVAGPTVRTIGEPLDVKRAPMTGYQGQFSGPYTIAAALLGGSGLGLGLDDFTDELVQDQDRRALMARVTVYADPSCDEVFPYHFPAILHVRTTDGHEFREEVMTNRGSLDNPLSDEELAQKFEANVRDLMDDAEVEGFRSTLLSDREAVSVGDLMERLSRLSPPKQGA
jgi:2-methylcitrate dehydratase PrpD